MKCRYVQSQYVQNSIQPIYYPEVRSHYWTPSFGPIGLPFLCPQGRLDITSLSKYANSFPACRVFAYFYKFCHHICHEIISVQDLHGGKHLQSSVLILKKI